MRLFLAFLLLALSFSAEAAQRITATISITNTPANTATLVVNGSTRTWKTTVSTPATEIAVTNSAVNATTNLFRHILTAPFSGPINAINSGATNIQLVGAIDQAMVVSSSGSWCTITLSTNTVTTMNVVRVPGSGETAAVRTNNFSLLTTAVNDYSTNAISQYATAASQLVGLASTQTITGPKTISSASSRWLNGELTNAELKSVIIRFDNTNINGIYFKSGADGLVSAIAPDVNGIPSVYGTIINAQPTNALSYSPASNNLLTRGGGDTYYGRLGAFTNLWTSTNTFAQITNSTIYGGVISNAAIQGGTISGPVTISAASSDVTVSNITANGLIKADRIELWPAGVFAADISANVNGGITFGYGAGDLNAGTINIGTYAGEDGVGGNQYSVSIGEYAGRNLVTGDYNTTLGSFASPNLTTGDYNTVLGSKADPANGSSNVVIGASATVSANKHFNVIIGPGASGGADHGEGVLGANTMTTRWSIPAGSSASERARIGGMIYADNDSDGVGTGSEETLKSYSVPANTLGTDNDSIAFTGSGYFLNNANGKSLKVKFGASTVFDTGSVAFNNIYWTLNGKVIRVSGGQKVWINFQSTYSSMSATNIYTTTAESTSSAIDLLVTGDGGASGDIYAHTFDVRWDPAP